MARKIEVALVGDSKSLERAFGKAQGSGSKLGKALGTGLKVAAGVGAAALGGLAVAAKIGFDEFTEAQKVTAQTNAVLKSTGKVANVTAKEVGDLAEALMKKSGVDDEVIASSQNVLLTFTNIRNEVGKGNDIFTQATKTILDMSVALGTDLQSSTIQVGKALNDPIKGITALTRVGVSFTEAQKEQIKELVEAGETMKAQKLILKELRKEFGGSAKAAGKTFAGQINILRESFNNWAGDMVAKVMPTIVDVFDRIGKFFDRIGRAQGFTAKLKIAWVGIGGVVADLFDRIRKEMLGGREALKLPGGQILEWTETQGVIDKLRDAIEGADWTKIGQTIGENLSSKVRVTAEFITNVLQTANQVIDQNIDKFADLGAKMLLKIVSKLLDPAFWKDNWKLILGIAVAVFPLGRVATLGGKIGGFLGRGIVTAFMRWTTRLPILVQEAARLVRLLFERLTGFIGEQLARIPGWIRAAFRLSAVLAFVNGVKRLFDSLREKVGQVWDWIKNKLSNLNLFSVVQAFNPVLNIINTIISAVKELIGLIKDIPSPGDIVGGIGGAIRGALPGGASGGDIARGGLMRVHSGERLLPAKIVNRGLTGAAAGGFGGEVRVIVVGGDQAGLAWVRGLDTREKRRTGGRGIL